MTEIWAATTNNTMEGLAAKAAAAKAAGFERCFMSDSQNIRMERWVALTVAAAATSTLGLGPFVTNQVTRHPAVTASAAASLQEYSGGRVVLGVGRGDYAWANLGYGPVPFERFRRFVNDLRQYLRGEPVDFDPDFGAGLPRAGSLDYAETWSSSRIHWLPTERPRGSVNVVASGRR